MIQPSPLENLISQALQKRAQNGALRSAEELAPGIDFCSNDYLGFARSSSTTVQPTELVHGSGGSRLISGTALIHKQAERAFSVFHRAESALIFNSGYDANLGLLSALATKEITILLDEYSHASLHDGARLGFAKVWKFRHNDLHDLAEKAARATTPVLVVAESIYSMDGDSAPLPELVALCEKIGADLVLDEAHAVGLYGPMGEGLAVEHGLESKIFARIVTFGKALGRHGAAVLGSANLTQYLINFARSFIYTTALSPASIYSIIEAYENIVGADQERKKLFSLVEYFNSLAQYNGLQLANSMLSPIRPVIISGNEQVCAVADMLVNEGMQIKAIRSPTVPEGLERIRITLHSYNSREEVERLIMLIAQSIAAQQGKKGDLCVSL